ncbi:MAG: YqgE/AlgH family protein [Verrucomicrobiae bacterium]
MMTDSNFTGSILVAHPALADPHFRRALIFISQHQAEDGAMGFVLNRPLGEAISRPGGLPEIPVYYGGPVQPENILLASLQWRENPTMLAFRAFAGRAGEDPAEQADWLPGLRAFAGYSGWAAGQLEDEISQKTWLVVPPSKAIIEMNPPQDVWKATMREAGPMFHLLSEAPDDPWKN